MKTCLSTVDNCSDPNFNEGSDEQYVYGNGLIKLTQVSIGGRDVELCQVINEATGEKDNYLPIVGWNNKQKE